MCAVRYKEDGKVDTRSIGGVNMSCQPGYILNKEEEIPYNLVKPLCNINCLFGGQGNSEKH